MQWLDVGSQFQDQVLNLGYKSESAEFQPLLDHQGAPYKPFFKKQKIVQCQGLIHYYFSVIKKNKIMPFAATWMDLKTLIPSEVNQKEKDKYHMMLLISGI